MPDPAPTRLSPRERLRWRRAMDERLIDAIFGRVVRDMPVPAGAAALSRLVGETPAIATTGNRSAASQPGSPP